MTTETQKLKLEWYARGVGDTLDSFDEVIAGLELEGFEFMNIESLRFLIVKARESQKINETLTSNDVKTAMTTLPH